MMDLHSLDLVPLLASAHSEAPDPRLAELYEALACNWLAVGRQAYPDLQFDLRRLIPDVFCKLTFRPRQALSRRAFGRALRDASSLERSRRSFLNPTVPPASPVRRSDLWRFRRKWQVISLARWPDYPDEFESATQDTCVKLTTLARKEELGAIISLERYATRVFVNRMLDTFATGGTSPHSRRRLCSLRRQSLGHAAELDASPEEARERGERCRLVRDALDRLTANKKCLLHLKYFKVFLIRRSRRSSE